MRVRRILNRLYGSAYLLFLMSNQQQWRKRERNANKECKKLTIKSFIIFQSMAACMRGWASILLWKVGLKCHFNSTLFGTMELGLPKTCATQK